MTGDAFSTGGIGAQGDLAGGAGLVEEESGFSLLGPLAEKPAVLACLSTLAPSLSTVGFGPIEVTDLAIFFELSLVVGICSTTGDAGLESVAVFVVDCVVVGAGSG
jgi:hypothetical protein